MKKPPFRLGPLALLLTVISICLTILAILTFTTARADLRLSEEYAQTTKARCALEAQGQEYLSRLNQGLETAPKTDEDGLCRVELEHEGYLLHIALRPGAGGYEIASWKSEKIWEQSDTIDNLWNGSFTKGE